MCAAPSNAARRRVYCGRISIAVDPSEQSDFPATNARIRQRPAAVGGICRAVTNWPLSTVASAVASDDGTIENVSSYPIDGNWGDDIHFVLVGDDSHAEGATDFKIANPNQDLAG